MPPILKSETELKKQQLPERANEIAETESSVERQRDLNHRVPSDLDSKPSLQKQEGCPHLERTPNRSAIDLGKGIPGNKKRFDVTRDARTLEENRGDQQGPGRKTVETRLIEKAIHEPESQRSAVSSSQSNRVQPRDLIKETLKELDRVL